MYGIERVVEALAGSLGMLGAVVLTFAVAPQVVQLVRTWRADDFHPAYITISLTGCLLLTAHAAVLRDPAFLLVNGCGVVFWSLVAIVHLRPGDARREAAPAEWADAQGS